MLSGISMLSPSAAASTSRRGNTAVAAHNAAAAAALLSSRRASNAAACASGGRLYHHQRRRCPLTPPPSAAAAAGGPNGNLPPAAERLAAELRADPALAPLLNDPKVMAAAREVAADPSALARYAGDARVMRALRRLVERDMPLPQAAAFTAMGTTPGGALDAMASDPELTALLAKPNVRAALAAARADPLNGLDRWAGDADVQRALELLERALAPAQAGNGSGSDGSGGIVDVDANAVE